MSKNNLINVSSMKLFSKPEFCLFCLLIYIKTKKSNKSNITNEMEIVSSPSLTQQFQFHDISVPLKIDNKDVNYL